MDSKMPNQILAHFLFHLFKNKVEQEISRSRTYKTFTPHGVSHILGVEDSIENLVRFHGPTRQRDHESPFTLSWLERLLLQFCAWGHDLGMMESVAEEYWDSLPDKLKQDELKDEILRKEHDKASAGYVRRSLPDLLSRTAFELKHGRKNEDGGSLAKTPEECQAEYRSLILRAIPELPSELADRFLGILSWDQGFFSRMHAEANGLASTVNLIARYHRRAVEIDECPSERYLFGEPIRTRLLAAVFRLADALHVDSTRFEREPYEIFRALPEFREEDRVHWIKSFIVSSIRVEPQQNALHVQADLPVGAGNVSRGQRSEVLARLREMLSFIITDLEEDVLSVSKILVRNDFPLLLGVTYEVQEIPAMEYADDIRAALDSIYAASSPNTSQLITIALGGLKARLLEAEKNRSEMAEHIDREVKRQLEDIKAQQKKRPCHEGLRKIGELLEAVASLWLKRGGQEKDDERKKAQVPDTLIQMSRIEGSEGERISRGRLMWTLTEGVHEVFIHQREKVRSSCTDCSFYRGLLEGCRHLVVYGYSQQVIDLLEGYIKSKPDPAPHIHVLECRTKTIYSSSGKLLYLDGQRYAKALADRLKEAARITLEPDVALGRIIHPPQRDAEATEGPTVILLGSNAVYPDGTFVHSMGHTAVAAVAKAPGLAIPCQVVVVTDGMKIGRVPEKEEEQERNPDRWLTHNRDIVEDLKNRGVELHNWREDRVPPELIDYLVVLDSRKVLRREDSRPGEPFVGLSRMEFDARREYAMSLEKRILASVISHSPQRRDFADALRELFPSARDHEQNWYVAESYLAQRFAADAATSEPAARLYQWLSTTWGKDQRDAAQALADRIHPPNPAPVAISSAAAGG